MRGGGIPTDSFSKLWALCRVSFVRHSALAYTNHVLSRRVDHDDS